MWPPPPVIFRSQLQAHKNFYYHGIELSLYTEKGENDSRSELGPQQDWAQLQAGEGGEQVTLFARLLPWIETCDYQAYVWALWLDTLCLVARTVVLSYPAGEIEGVFTVVVIWFLLWMW